MTQRDAPSLRTAALISIASGLVGGAAWTLDLMDRSDGDDLRWGFWHNPLMGFTPFSETFLEASMYVLWACAAAIGLGGLMLLARFRWGAYLVLLQAPASIAVNTIVVGAITLMALGLLDMQWTGLALVLRLGSIAVNLVLWKVIRSAMTSAPVTS